MRKLGRKALALSLALVLGTSMLLTGCGGSKSGNKGGSGDGDLGISMKLDKCKG